MANQQHMLKLALEVATALTQTDEPQHIMSFGRNNDGDLELTLHDMDSSDQAGCAITESGDVMTNEILAEELTNKILFEA